MPEKKPKFQVNKLVKMPIKIIEFECAKCDQKLQEAVYHFWREFQQQEASSVPL